MAETLSHPPYWLVFSVGWPDNASRRGMAECAAAVAPRFIRRRALSRPAARVCEFADAVAGERGYRVVFFSDLTGELREAGGTWAEVGVPDWERALAALQDGAPALVFTLSRYAHMLLCTAGQRETTVHSPSDPGGHRVTAAETADLRDRLGRALRRDWPHYINDLHRAGSLQRG